MGCSSPLMDRNRAASRHKGGKQQKSYPNIDRHIGNIEDPYKAQLRRIDEVNDRADANAVECISNRAGDEKAKPGRTQRRG